MKKEWYCLLGLYLLAALGWLILRQYYDWLF